MSRAFTEEQSRSIETTDQGVALFAAAGSGKTSVLVERYLKLMTLRRQPKEILCVTFTTEAAQQMRDRITRRLESDERTPPSLIQSVKNSARIGTIHSFCYGIIEEFGDAAQLDRISGIADSFVYSHRFESSYDEWLETVPEEKLNALLSVYSREDIRELCRDLYECRHRFKLGESTNLTSAQSHLLNLWEASESLRQSLQQHLLGQGLYQFDDLEYTALHLLQTQPESLKTLQNQIKHLLVDEFQDTSETQWEILRRVVGTQPKKLFIVGDPKQSIYRFRKADVGIFLSVADRLTSRGGEKLSLSKNFRSQPGVLDFVNGVSRQLFEESPIPFEPMVPGRTAETETCVEVKAVAAESKGELAQNEMDFICQRIEKLLSEGVSADSIAVLFRVSERILPYYQELARRGIPSRCRQTLSLFNTYDILDLCHYLEALNDPFDDFALSAFLLSPYVGWDYAELNERLPSKEALFESLITRGDPRTSWLMELVESGENRAAKALETLFRNSSYWPSETEAFCAFLEGISGRDYTLAEAANRIRYWKRADLPFQATSGNEGVRLLTVHGAKGLEFSHVFLADNARQGFRVPPKLLWDKEGQPHTRFRKNGELQADEEYVRIAEEEKRLDLEESKRILYVALTRAENSLCITVPQNRKWIPKNSWADWLSPEE